MAYRNCKFCRGRGCVACDGERERAAAKRETPVFVAAANDPRDMELLKGALGATVADAAVWLESYRAIPVPKVQGQMSLFL